MDGWAFSREMTSLTRQQCLESALDVGKSTLIVAAAGGGEGREGWRLYDSGDLEDIWASLTSVHSIYLGFYLSQREQSLFGQ